MNAKQITTALIQGTFTNEELASIIDAIKYARLNLGKATKRSLSVVTKFVLLANVAAKQLQAQCANLLLKILLWILH